LNGRLAAPPGVDHVLGKGVIVTRNISVPGIFAIGAHCSAETIRLMRKRVQEGCGRLFYEHDWASAFLGDEQAQFFDETVRRLADWAYQHPMVTMSAEGDEEGPTVVVGA
jgi:hypothetical protein